MYSWAEAVALPPQRRSHPACKRNMPKRRAIDEDSELGSVAGGDSDDEGEQLAQKERPAKKGRSRFIDDEVDVEDEDEVCG